MQDSRTMEQRLKDMEDKLDAIHIAIIGDKYDPEKGMMPRLKKAEAYIERDKKLKWIGAGIVAVLSWFGTHLKEFFVTLFNSPPNH